MRVLVTGSNGYIGRYVMSALRLAGHHPIGFLRPGTLHALGDVETVTGDLLDRESLAKAVGGVEAVCHLAGLRRSRESWNDATRYFKVNVGGTIALLEAMDSAGVDRLVFASTAAIYGSPTHVPVNEDEPDQAPHPYACSKLAAELAIHAQTMGGRLGAVILRLLNIAGNSDPDPTRMVPRIITAAAKTARLEISGDGSVVRDYLHVEDAARAFVLALSVADRGHCRRYNIGSGKGYSVLDIISVAEKLMDRPIHIVHGPPEDGPQFLVCNSAKAQAELAWKPEKSNLETIVSDALLVDKG